MDRAILNTEDLLREIEHLRSIEAAALAFVATCHSHATTIQPGATVRSYKFDRAMLEALQAALGQGQAGERGGDKA